MKELDENTKFFLYPLIDAGVTLAAFCACLMRLIGNKELIFKDIAHVVAGIALGGWILRPENWKWWVWCFWILIAVELLCALVLYPIK